MNRTMRSGEKLYEKEFLMGKRLEERRTKKRSRPYLEYLDNFEKQSNLKLFGVDGM